MLKTDWDNISSWYEDYLKGDDTYQTKVIAPNLLRMLEAKKSESILDLACGEGFFSRLVAGSGAVVTGVDLSKELTAKAQNKSKNINFLISPAHDTKLKKETFDKAFTVLAFENIKNIDEVVLEIKRVLKVGGQFFLVMLHPAFRIPQHSDWGFDNKKLLQYRRVDKYLSEIKIDIKLNPHKGAGKASSITFHRPLQWYMKIFKKHGFVLAGLEEWISHKKSEFGTRQKAEDLARKEFPMFIALELRKL